MRKDRTPEAIDNKEGWCGWCWEGGKAEDDGWLMGWAADDGELDRRAVHDQRVDQLVGNGSQGRLTVAGRPEIPHGLEHLGPAQPAVELGVDRHPGQLTNVSAEQLHEPTPCAEFDVTELVEHLMAVQERIRGIAVDGHVDGAPFRLAFEQDSVAEDFARRVHEFAVAWEAWQEDELWSKTVTAPFGTGPGGAALMVYTSENLTHGWDLAVATGQDSEADPAIVAPILAGMYNALPADNRGDDIPFNAVVESAEGAGPTEQLANRLARSR